jgi:hypothetical protein
VGKPMKSKMRRSVLASSLPAWRVATQTGVTP